MKDVKLLNLAIALLMSPLLLGIINRTKAIFAGRHGQPLLQAYFDIWKLLQKGAVYSDTTSWVFRLAPTVGLAVVLAATAFVPFGTTSSLLAFQADFVLFAYLFGLMRFCMVLSALDTGSSFEGMGASREVLFSALAEVALILGLAAIAKTVGSLSLSGMLSGTSALLWKESTSVLALVSGALLIVFLTENCRIPIDDPNTHLELTMVHEVMVLDHSGPDLGLILYSSALKLWIIGSVLVEIVLPLHSGNLLRDEVLFLGGMLGLSVLVGAIESTMARLKLLQVPQLLVGAAAASTLAFFLVLR